MNKILEELDERGFDVCVSNHSTEYGGWHCAYCCEPSEQYVHVYAPTLRACLGLLAEESGVCQEITREQQLEGDLM